MDFLDSMTDLAKRISKSIDFIQTEEATKQAYIIPFISLLGYDVYNPLEVIPEFTADIGIKKGEKVDYVIMRDSEPIMLIECKHCKSDLDIKHESQLFRYFTATKARVGILTNGIIYKFYTDLEKPNQMDERPFLEINLFDIQENLVKELKKFSKDNFDINNMISTANELKYTREITFYINEQVNNPSDDFVKLIASQVYRGKMMQSVVEKFREITKKAFKQYINDLIQNRLKSILTQEETTSSPEDTVDQQPSTQIIKDAIVTTEDEKEALYIVKSILRDYIDIKRISYRDYKSFCNILLDDSIRKPICKLYFNSAQKQISFFDNTVDIDKKIEDKAPINDLDAIYSYSSRLIKTLQLYENTEKNNL